MKEKFKKFLSYAIILFSLVMCIDESLLFFSDNTSNITIAYPDCNTNVHHDNSGSPEHFYHKNSINLDSSHKLISQEGFLPDSPLISQYSASIWQPPKVS